MFKKEGEFFERGDVMPFIDFNQITIEQLTSLKDRIKQCGGTIHIIVHPYYSATESVHTDIGNLDPIKLAMMRDGVEDVIEKQTVEDTPIFIFEEESKLHLLDGKLNTKTRIDTYMIATVPDDSAPFQGSWDDLNKKLQDLGVSRVLISGMNLSVIWPDDGDPELAGCIPSATESLSKKFAIEISDLVYPNSKDDYLRFNGPTGPIKTK